MKKVKITMPSSLISKKEPISNKNSILEELIDTFINILKQKEHEENLQNLYRNITTLKIDNKRILSERKINPFQDNVVTGQYYLEENLISVLPLQQKEKSRSSKKLNIREYIINLYHELLHMASTIMDKENNIAYSGFAVVTKNNSIGLAIDDAYTEILLKRYFDSKNIDDTYDYEIIITLLIEDLVGSEKMTNLYFNANLSALVKMLENYNTKENIYKFLDDFDSIYALRDYSRRYKRDIIYYHNEIQDFIINTYMNKLKIDLNNNIINKEEYEFKLNKCTETLHTAFVKLNLNNKNKTLKK